MKTPREILFERHQSAQPKLDALRRQALAECAETTVPPEMSARVGPQFKWSHVPLKLWQELIWPCRRIWAGLAAIWFVLLLLNLNLDERPAVATNRTSTLTPEVLMALREQRELLAQLLDSTPSAPASPAPPAAHGPRSELRESFLLA